MLSSSRCGCVEERQPSRGCDAVVSRVVAAQACTFVTPMGRFQALLTPEDGSESPVQGRTRERGARNPYKALQATAARPLPAAAEARRYAALDVTRHSSRDGRYRPKADERTSFKGRELAAGFQL